MAINKTKRQIMVRKTLPRKPKMILRKSNQFLLNQWHPSCYSC